MTSLRRCTCREPRPSGNPRRDRTCVICGWHIPREWDTSRVGAFLARLTDIPEVLTATHFEDMKLLCQLREEIGRSDFGYRYLARRNERDAKEEAADLANYAAMGVLQRLRNGEDPCEDLALTAAFRAFQAFEALAQIEAKVAGAP